MWNAVRPVSLASWPQRPRFPIRNPSLTSTSWSWKFSDSHQAPLLLNSQCKFFAPWKFKQRISDIDNELFEEWLGNSDLAATCKVNRLVRICTESKVSSLLPCPNLAREHKPPNYNWDNTLHHCAATWNGFDPRGYQGPASFLHAAI